MTHQTFMQMCEEKAAGLERLAARLHTASNRESFQALADAWRRVAATARERDTSVPAQQ